MNHLNSVLLEGEVVAAPTTDTTPDGTARCRFCIGNTRKDGTATVSAVALGRIAERLAEVCDDYLKAGRRVRTIGRIAQDHDAEGHPLYLLLEHVEFCPERK